MERPMTDAPVSGNEFDLRAGKTLAPTFIFITYGVVKFFTLGTSLTHWPDTYLAVAGGIASWLAMLLWGVVVWGDRKPSLFRALCALTAYIPMLYSTSRGLRRLLFDHGLFFRARNPVRLCLQWFGLPHGVRSRGTHGLDAPHPLIVSGTLCNLSKNQRKFSLMLFGLKEFGYRIHAPCQFNYLAFIIRSHITTQIHFPDLFRSVWCNFIG
jgi:hypothetical protein